MAISTGPASRDRHDKPPDTQAAQAVWLSDRWGFVPFAFGNFPLRKLCQTQEEASKEAKAFEASVRAAMHTAKQIGSERRSFLEVYHNKLRHWLKKWVLQDLSLGDVNVPSGFCIYRIEAGQTLYLVKPSDGPVFEEALPGYEAAVDLCRDLGAAAPRAAAVQ